MTRKGGRREQLARRKESCVRWKSPKKGKGKGIQGAMNGLLPDRKKKTGRITKPKTLEPGQSAKRRQEI